MARKDSPLDAKACRRVQEPIDGSGRVQYDQERPRSS
jgi:hypothetical protein